MTPLTRTDEPLAEMAKPLGRPARIAILRTLSERACLCGQIVEVLPLAVHGV